jgi:GTP-dependent phosphoenolpyruvate carboxykinase
VYIQEIEKLEKERRAAKRAFEQRIQKHKAIQEACEVDIGNLETERECKLQNFAKKEESIEKHMRKEVAKWEDEFERYIEVLM